MLCKDIINVIETTYPKHAALEWDNVGLLIGSKDAKVQKIYLALDATEAVIDAAIDVEADMLITHHPLIFTGMKQIVEDDFIGKRIMKLIRHGISYYAMHTNYDVLGMADLAADMVELVDREVLECTNDQEGIGRVGNLKKEMSLKECCDFIKCKFQVPNVKVMGDMARMVKRVAISPGSGKHMSDLALEKNADVFITADIDYHEGLDAVARELAIIDAGHYGLEHIFVSDIAKYLSENIKDIEICQEEVMHPFQIV